MQSYRSCRVRRVLVYVVVGEIARQNGRGLGAGMQVHNDPHLATGQVDQVAGLRRFSAPADRDPVDRHVDLVTINGVADRKSTRLNSSHVAISYAVFCLKKKNDSDVDSTFNEPRTNSQHKSLY